MPTIIVVIIKQQLLLRILWCYYMPFLHSAVNEENCCGKQNPLVMLPFNLFLFTILSFSALNLCFTVVWRTMEDVIFKSWVPILAVMTLKWFSLGRLGHCDLLNTVLKHSCVNLIQSSATCVVVSTMPSENWEDMGLEISTQSEVNQMQKDKYHLILPVCEILKKEV